MEIKKDIKNELFKRKELSIILESEKNPNFDDIRKKISEKFSKPEENIDVYNINGKFGRKTFLIKAYVYDSVQDLKKAEQKTQKQRKEEKNKEEEEKKVAEASLSADKNSGFVEEPVKIE